MKKICFAIIFLTLACRLYGQEKYEFSIIEYSTFTSSISISKDGLEFGGEKVSPESGYNANPLLVKVKEFQSKGWEVMSFNTLLGKENGFNQLYMAYLRRKISK